MPYGCDPHDEACIIGDVDAFISTLEAGVFLKEYERMLAKRQQEFALYDERHSHVPLEPRRTLDASDD